MNATEDRAWFRRRLDMYAAGLLSDVEERRFQDLLTRRSDCRQDFETYVMLDADREPSDGHIPPAILVRWDRARRALRGFERRMVGAHLESCARCREDLKALGFEARLGETSEASPVADTRAPATVSAANGGPSPRPQPAARPAVPARPRWPWIAWAVTATAALLLMLLRPEPARVPALDPQGGAIPWTRSAVLRGSGIPTPLVVEPATRAVAVAVRIPFDWPDETGAQLEVQAPDGEVLLRASVAEREMAERTLLVLVRSEEALPEGVYRVLLSPEPEGSARPGGATTGRDPEESFFELAHRG